MRLQTVTCGASFFKGLKVSHIWSQWLFLYSWEEWVRVIILILSTCWETWAAKNRSAYCVPGALISTFHLILTKPLWCGDCYYPHWRWKYWSTEILHDFQSCKAGKGLNWIQTQTSGCLGPMLATTLQKGPANDSCHWASPIQATGSLAAGSRAPFLLALHFPHVNLQTMSLIIHSSLSFKQMSRKSTQT